MPSLIRKKRVVRASVAFLCVVLLAGVSSLATANSAATSAVAGTPVTSISKASRLLVGVRRQPPEPNAALEQLHGVKGPAAALLRIRALMHKGEHDAAIKEHARVQDLKSKLPAALVDALAVLAVELDLAHPASAKAAWSTARQLLGGTYPFTTDDVVRFGELLAASRPKIFLSDFAHLRTTIAKVSSRGGRVLSAGDARARLWQLRADVASHLSDTATAHESLVELFLDEPQSDLSPPEPPPGMVVGGEPGNIAPERLLRRAEKLLDAHFNSRAIDALSLLKGQKLDLSQACRVDFARGLAERKLHHYAAAERELIKVVNRCKDRDLTRRALFVATKVVSIYRGLGAVPLVERFAREYRGHSMVDDVLFWAGDLHQRRGKYQKAIKYYRQVERQRPHGDQCSKARWRRAFIAIEQKRPCGSATKEVERSNYWRARVRQLRGNKKQATADYLALRQKAPLGYYSQLAFVRLTALLGEKALGLAEDGLWYARPQIAVEPSNNAALSPACLDDVRRQPQLDTALTLLDLGLLDDAAAYLGAALGDLKSGARKVSEFTSCAGLRADELVAALLQQCGYYADSHFVLRRAVTRLLSLPAAARTTLLRLSFPLVYDEELRFAEAESDVPSLFMQALSREESAFDAEVISWAGAYGLTQLLLATGRSAAKLLRPPVEISGFQDLLRSDLSARLGAALIAQLLSRLGDSTALSLVGYNASQNLAREYFKRFAGVQFDVFAESIGIRETRRYVKRVLSTWGVYLWLYGEKPLVLPHAIVMPG